MAEMRRRMLDRGCRDWKNTAKSLTNPTQDPPRNKKESKFLAIKNLALNEKHEKILGMEKSGQRRKISVTVPLIACRAAAESPSVWCESRSASFQRPSWPPLVWQWPRWRRQRRRPRPLAASWQCVQPETERRRRRDEGQIPSIERKEK
jgi:hypothetical protein